MSVNIVRQAKMYMKSLTACLCLMVVLPMQAMAATPAEQLKNVLKDVNTFSGKFVQTVRDVDGKLVQEGRGHLDLAKPGKIHWTLHEPAVSKMISDSQTLWLYDPDLEQVTLYDPQKLITDSPFALLMSDDKLLWQQYSITLVGEQFVVSPKHKESQVTKIALTFNGKQLQKLVIWDASEQQSEYVFANVSLNTSFPATHFAFTIPADTDIDDQRN